MLRSVIYVFISMFIFNSIASAGFQRVRNSYHNNVERIAPPSNDNLFANSNDNLSSERSATLQRNEVRYHDSSYTDDDYVDADYYIPPQTDGIKIKGRSKYPNHSFPSKMLATGKRHVIFNPQYLAWAAYDEQGSLVKTGAASGGKAWCADIQQSCRTPAGSYAVERIMSKHYRSKTFPRRANGNHGGAKMSYAMFFHRGYALHHSDSLPETNASHGCVRVSYEASKWLNKEFVRIGTQVTVRPYSDPPVTASWARKMRLATNP